MKRYMAKKTITRILSLVLVTAFLTPFIFSSGVNHCGKTDSFRGHLCKEGVEKDYIISMMGERRTGLTRHEEMRLAEVIREVSGSYDVDPLFVLALIEQESRFYNWAKSHRGAMGLMQVRLKTGRDVARELNIEWEGERTLFNPYLNVKMGVHYFSFLLVRYDNDIMKALAAYNSGPTYVTAMLDLGEEPSKAYGKKVFTHYKTMKEGTIF